MAVLTIRGVSEETLHTLRREADEVGRSMSRHVAVLLDRQAERCRRRVQLRRLAERLQTVRAARPASATDSAGLLWAERGGR